MRVKFGLKIPNRLGKNVRKPQGGIFFDSHCTVNAVCNILSDNFPSQSKTEIITRHTIHSDQPVCIICGCQLPSFDNEPTDKEHKTGKEQYIQQVAVVTELCHRRHSTHCCTQEATGIVKVIVLHSHITKYTLTHRGNIHSL